MTYARVAIAAIKRYRIEAPFRAQYRERFPNKSCTCGFGHLIQRMVSAGMLKHKDIKELKKRYLKLSRQLHGNKA